MSALCEVGYVPNEEIIIDDPDIAFEKRLFRTTHPDVLKANLLNWAEHHPDKHSHQIVEAIVDIENAYGDSTRKLTNTYSILHPLRLAQPSPSMENITSTQILISLLHDMPELFKMRPDELAKYGKDVVTGVKAFTQMPDETYADYKTRFARVDAAHPELGLQKLKDRDTISNCFDPVALPEGIPRNLKTIPYMTRLLGKYADHNHIYSNHGDNAVWAGKVQKTIRIVSKAIQRKQLVM